MAKLKIYEYPHPVLKQKAEKVAVVDDQLRTLLDNMLETMYAANGCGLAAPQIGLSKRVVVIDIAHEGEKPAPLYMVNPEIVWRSEEMEIGKECKLQADGFLAVAAQHEIDHLDGVLYIDHLSRLKRQMLVKKLEKSRKEKR